MSNTVSLGSKKKSYGSIRLAAQAAGVPYMTFYMRLRAGMKPVTAVKKKVRAYNRRTAIDNSTQSIYGNQQA